MYMIEITEDEYENIKECIHKGMKYIDKAVECMEKTADKKHSNYEERYNEDDDYSDDYNNYHSYKDYHDHDDELDLIAEQIFQEIDNLFNN